MTDLQNVELAKTKLLLPQNSNASRHLEVTLVHIDDPSRSMFSIKKKQCDLWEFVWSSSLYLSSILSRVDMRSLKVLEIGCGNGLNSVVSAKSGAQVTASDLVEDAVTITRLSAMHNGVEQLMTFKTLSWNCLQEFPEEQYDVVLASDCLFFSGTIEPVTEAVLKALKPGGIGIVVDLFHLHAHEFVQRLKERNVQHEMFHFEPSMGSFPQYSSNAFLKMKSGRLVLLSKPSGEQTHRLKIFKKRIMEEIQSFLPK